MLAMLLDTSLADLVVLALGVGLPPAVLAAAFFLEAWRELGPPRPAPAAGPGEWYEVTPAPADTRPMGKLPASVEAELAKLAAMIPDRPA